MADVSNAAEDAIGTAGNEGDVARDVIGTIDVEVLENEASPNSGTIWRHGMLFASGWTGEEAIKPSGGTLTHAASLRALGSSASC